MRRLAVILLLAVLLGGCSNLGFYYQAVSGHFDLMGRRQPIERLLQDASTPADLRRSLLGASAARDFASQHLGLPDNPSYRSYADLQRPFVTWNVVAAPEFSVEAKTWCYVHMVCLPYRGYFDEASARRYADGLAAEGFDVHVYGIAAYSTSGWFDDPLLNTMVRLGERRTAALIFHELAHQQLFLKRDGAFSEAFATFVEQEGMRRWLAQGRQRQLEFLALLRWTRDRLAEVYAGAEDPARMRQAKQAVFDRLRLGYAELRERWGGYAGYDAWFESPLNNARLVLVSTYHERVPAFEALLQRHGGDLQAFYRAAAEIAELEPQQRERRLDELAGGAALR